FNRRFRRYRRELGEEGVPGAGWHDEWHRHWAEKWERERDRHSRREEARAARRAERDARRWGAPMPESEPRRPLSPEEEALRRARRRAAAQAGFYGHLMSYLGVIAFLALINLFTAWDPWFLWPALGWGIGLFAHWMAVFGSRTLKERFFAPAVERELRRERASMQTEKQASID